MSQIINSPEMWPSQDARRFGAAQVAGWTTVVTAAVLAEGPGAVADTGEAVLAIVFFSGLGIAWSTLFASAILRLGLHRGSGRNAVVYSLVISAILGVLWWASVAGIDAGLGSRFARAVPAGVQPGRWYLYVALEYALALAGWSGVYMAVLFSRRAARASADAARASEAAAVADRLAREAELRRLRSQLNPHFLFNSLNSVSALIAIDPDRARVFIEDLGGLLRRSLADESLGALQGATFGDELDFVQRLIRCEKARFEERLSVQFNVAPGLRSRPFPSMLLQPLVENAIQHGVERSTAVTRVEVRAEEGPTGLVVEVRNTGSLSAPGPATSSVGIANVKARLAAMGHPKDAFVLSEQDGWVSARLTLG